MWTQDKIELQGWQLIPERMSALGLTAEDGLAQVWFVEPVGQLTGGAEAINQLLRYVWWARPFAYLYYLPGIRQLEDWLYRWVANNRYRMPGSSEACAMPDSAETRGK